jgi:DNA-binding XRE family transcriptional regulator
VLKNLVLDEPNIKPRPLTFGDKNFVCLEVPEYELLKQRLRAENVLLALLSTVLPDLEKRISRVKGKVLREILGRLDVFQEGKSEEVGLRPPCSLVAKAKKVLGEEGDYVSLTDFKKEIAVEEIRKARKQAGMTQKELADKAGLTQPHLSKLERVPSSASAATLRKIATVLRVRVIV